MVKPLELNVSVKSPFYHLTPLAYYETLGCKEVPLSGIDLGLSDQA